MQAFKVPGDLIKILVNNERQLVVSKEGPVALSFKKLVHATEHLHFGLVGRKVREGR